jgi:hypothetical protein
MDRHRASIALFVILALALAAWLASPVQALRPTDSHRLADELLPQSPEGITRALSRGAGDLPAADRLRAERSLTLFSQRTGGRWQVLSWNPVTLTPRLVTGSGVPTGEAVLGAADAEQVARGFIDAGATLTSMRAEALAVQKVSHGLGKWSVHFTQRVDDFPVIGSRFTVAMTETGRIAAFGGDLWPELRAPRAPVLDRAAALAAAVRELSGRGLAPAAPGAGDRVEILQLGVLPVSATEGRLVYRVDTFFREPLAAWLVDVDAMSGQVMQVQNVLRTADLSGTASGALENPGWCFGVADWPVQLLAVEFPDVGVDTTDANGDFLVPWTGTEVESIRAEMSGPWFHVDNVMGDDALFLGLITPGVPFALYWDDSTARMDERDVFHHANNAHEFIKWLDPDWTDLDWQMPANVNLQQSCNAFWSGSDINFFHETTPCANTGQLGDVIHHEYGHGITDFMYGPNDPPSDMHEGNSDVIGNYLSNEPQMGRGFYRDCNTGIRNSDNSMTWPDSLNGTGHHDGQIIAGFNWDVRQNLMVTLGPEAGHQRASQIWHFARELGLPLTQPEQVWWTFIADDDDGNLDSGTPNWADICPAAERHGFSCPEMFTDVVIHHMALPYVAAPQGQTLFMEAQIYGLHSDINPDSVLVCYRAAGATEFNTTPMVATASESLWVAEIPGQSVGTLIEYYVFAADEAHHHLTDPRAAPAELHTSEVVTIYEPFETVGDWTVGAPGDNATQGIWAQIDPVGAIVGPYIIQPEDDTTPPPGCLCWITGQYDGGYAWYSDADGQTTLLSPVYNFSGADAVTVKFQRWFQTFGSQEGTMDVCACNDGGTWRVIDHAAGMSPTPVWEQVVVDLMRVIPDPHHVQFRVVMYGRPNPSLDEGGIDDFMVLAQYDPAGTDEETEQHGPELSLSTASLMGGVVDIRFALPTAGPVDLHLHDVSGRTVRHLVHEPMGAGVHEIRWDGRDASGVQLASGIYFVRLTTPSGERGQRAIIAR